MPAEVTIPQLGESVSEGVIARWLRQDGEIVKVDEPLLEVETDKATMELTATASGRLQIVEREGATVRVGTVVARIAVDAGAGAPGGAPRETPAEAGRQLRVAEAAPRREPQPAEQRPAEADELSPAVRKLVAEHQLDAAVITGTGKGGRLTKGDVLEHIEQRGSQKEQRGAQKVAPSPAAAEVRRLGSTPTSVAPPPDLAGAQATRLTATRPDRRAAMPEAAAATEQIERVPMTQLRRRIAERLVEAQRTAAILTTFNEIDLSALLAVRKRYRERFRQVHEVDLGLMSLFGRAAILALRAVPVVNAQIDGADVVYHRHVHLGIAVSAPRGLVVPVVRHADAMSLAELERAVGEAARLARDGKLTPDQLAGGTFTITNGGVFGSLLSTPILNPPQSGILGMHKIEDRPVAVDGQVVIRPMMYVALSYDHRLVDGEQAVTFLVRVKERIEDPVRMLLEV
jgi:2-oxoglutarate dehydrogenase E2 component (dihydrolipoamide succinyltransferase)